MDKKTLARVEVKDAALGQVEAVFATLDVIDKDGDVTLKGAFKNGTPVRISAFGHKSWEGALPVGKGTIQEVGNEVVLKGQFFMNTTGGKDTFEVVKAMSEADGPGMEWSYGFDVKDSEPGELDGQKVRYLKAMDIHEVSPVMLGAGVNTRTTGMKRTFTQAERDRMAANGEAMPDGSYPIANRQDLENAIHAVGRGSGSHDAIRAHIRKRARALGLTDLLPPDWPKSLNEEVSFAAWTVHHVVESAERVVALRAEKGKELSLVNRESLVELNEACDKLKALLDSNEDDNDAIRNEYLRFIASNL